MNYAWLIFQNADGISDCGCEWIHGTVVEMCRIHSEEYDKSLEEINDEN